MTVELMVRSANAEDDLVALAAWLREERELTGLVQQHRGQAGSTQLGGAWELITVAVGSGGLGSVLAGALTTWLQHRPKTTVKITRGDTAIEVEAGRVKDLPALLDKLMGSTEGGNESGG